MVRGISTAFALFLLLVCSLQAQSPVASTPAIEKKVDEMLAKLSLEEKIDLIGGVDGMYIREEPAIGLPRLKMSDGPVGVRTWGPATAFTAGIGLAASWDPELAKRVGKSLGEDARARGVNFLLGPGVNIYRAPMNGRNFEYFGEDPYLGSRMVVRYVEGVQSQGVVATVKHFALNNQEWDRHNVSSDADERTIREIYLPVFEAAVREGHAGAVMNSYNLINGVHATQNNWLNNVVLKKEWGFEGVLMSDWGSTYDGVAAANGGLDLEMPNADFMNRKALLPAIKQGQVSVATIDDKVRRILRTALQFGFMDRPQEDLRFSKYNQAARQVALDEARESIVLLKNETAVLPLDAKKIHSIAVIGPEAWPEVTGGGGSSTVTPYTAVSLLEALGKREGLQVLYAPGIPSVSQLINETNFQDDVKAEAFTDGSLTNATTISKQERLNDWKAGDWVPPGTPQSYRYTADFVPPRGGKYLFLTVAAGEDSYTLYVQGKPLIQESRSEGQAPRFAEIALTAGQRISLRVDYVVRAAKPRFGLGIRAVDELVSEDAKKIAAHADATVICVGFDPWWESEGFDRPYALPFGQEALIREVSAANKNTIVILTAGGEVSTANWLAGVPALLHNWYSGQEGGTAVAEILFGDRSPEGRLPISFARSWEQNPVHDNYYAPPAAPGESPHVKYAEGVFLGYRYYTSGKEKPLFPFGYGLTYTKFAFRDLNVAPATTIDGTVSVAFVIANRGEKAGTDVAQLYVGDPSAKVKRPAKELKGFQKVRLEPGEERQITLNLDKRAFSYWDEAIHGWKVDPGRFTVFVGDSSEYTPLAGEIIFK